MQQNYKKHNLEKLETKQITYPSKMKRSSTVFKTHGKAEKTYF